MMRQVLRSFDIDLGGFVIPLTLRCVYSGWNARSLSKNSVFIVSWLMSG